MINSTENLLIKKIAKIINKNLTDYSFCVVEGFKSSESFLNSNLYKIEFILVTEKNIEKIKKFEINQDKVILVSEKIINKLSNVCNSQGIISIFKKNYSENIDEFLLEQTYMLYNITDPGNLGTLIRTAVALNKKYLITIDGCHYHNFKVVQSTAGMLSQIKIIRIPADTFLRLLENKKNFLFISALDSKGDSMFKKEKSILNKTYLLIGNESNGIPTEIKKKVDLILSIPMSKNCESLNAAIAGSIAGYICWSEL